MNILSWVVIGVILLFVLAKNWDKIAPLINYQGFRRKETRPVNGEAVELDSKEINEMKEQKMNYLIDEKQKRLKQIEEKTAPLKAEVKELNIEIYLLQQNNNNVPKTKGFFERGK